MSLETKNNEIGTITIEQELKLTLLRHWTLYDSICNSNYLVSRLKINREPGNKSLKRFLITIGISQEQAQQKFQYMDSELRNNLKRKIIEKSQEFNIDKILISSYLRQMTSTMQVSALDAAFAISALLEYPHHINEFNEQQVKKPDAQNDRNVIHQQVEAKK